MKRLKSLVLIASSALVLSACGGNGNSSSSSSAASSASSSSVVSSSSSPSSLSSSEVTPASSEIFSESSIIESESSIEESSSEESSIESSYESSSVSSSEYIPLTDEDLGVLVGHFYASGYTLDVSATLVTLTSTEDGSVKEFVPTSVRIDEAKTRVNGVILKEKLMVVELYDENGDFHRLRMTPGGYHFLALQTVNEEGKFESIASFMPSMNEFAGAYNGYEKGSVDPNNYVYLYSSEFDEDYSGFSIYMVHAATSSYNLTSSYNRSFFLENEDGSYVKAIDIFDATDGEYFDMAVVVGEDGLDYFGGGECWYTDFSLIQSDLVDAYGYGISYYYDTDEAMLYDDDFEEVGTAEIVHGEEGYFTRFGSLEFHVSGDDFYFFDGEERFDAAPKFTFYDTDYYLDYGAPEFVAKDVDLTFGLDLDWETYDETFAVYFNEVAAENAIVKADGSGVVALFFTANETDYVFYRSTSTIGYLIGDNQASLLYSAPYYDEIFVQDYLNVTDGEFTAITIDDYRRGRIDGGDFIDGYYDYYPGYGVVFSFGNYLVFNYQGVNVLLDTEAMSSLYLIELDYYESLFADFIYKGENVVSLSPVGLAYEGVAVDHFDLEMMFDNEGSAHIAFSFADAEKTIHLIPESTHIFHIYSQGTDGVMAFGGDALDKDCYDSLVGDYLYEGEFGIETLSFKEDGTLFLDTLVGEGEIAPVDYEYGFYYDEEDECLVLEVLIPVAGQVVALDFEVEELGLSLPQAGLFYMNSALFKAQGLYVSLDDGLAIYVEGNTVKVNGTKVNAKFVETQQGVLIELGGFILDVPNDPEMPINYYDDESSFLLSKVDFDIVDYAGEWEYGENTYALSLNPSTGKYTMYKNGAFFMDSYTIVVEDGILTVVFSTPFGSVKLHLSGTEVLADISEGGLVPPPPSVV